MYKNYPYAHTVSEIEIDLTGGLLPKKPAPKSSACTIFDDDAGGAFIIKSANDWLQGAHKAPEAKMLFDKFWFEGELCILFADTNVGKSVLAVQIADSISRGTPIGNFQMDAAASSVLYFDFELSDKQFAKRYSSGVYGNYKFNDKLFRRAVLNPESRSERKFNRYEDYIENALENALITVMPKVLIIDNITCLRYGTQAESGALSLIRKLLSLKTKYGLSILVLAHTPKRNPAKPVTRNDLQGSKMLINFCDSAFAIGESQLLPGQRYLKQIKQRSINEEYGAGNVCMCHIVKPNNFLQFQFPAYAREADHLAHYTEQHRKNTEAQIDELSKQNLSLRQIAARMHISSATVFRVLKRLEERVEEEAGE
jgi:RecA-family ATPase